jgi:hypothetical protein
MLGTDRNETPMLENLKENLDHERVAQAETRQRLADLKHREIVARELIAIVRGVRGPAARYDRKAARRVLTQVKHRRALAEQSLHLSQSRLNSLEAQFACFSRNVPKKAMNSLNAGRTWVPLPPVEPPLITAEIRATAVHAVEHPLQGNSTARMPLPRKQFGTSIGS